jgi:tetratricopeptide (TPR) repeat protein
VCKTNWFLFVNEPNLQNSCGGGSLFPHVSLRLIPAFFVFSLAFWLIAPRATNCQTLEEQVAAHFRAGQQALRQGELTQAEEEFKKVLALDPKLAEARVNLGLVYHALGEYSRSASNLATALREKPDLAGPTSILGIDYLKLGETQKGIPVLQRALRMDPSNLEGRRALALCYVSKDGFRQAADEYRELARLNLDKSDALYLLGHDYVNLAAHLAFRGAEVYRGSPWGNRFLGDMLAQRARWNDAAEEYAHSLAGDPKQPGLHTSLGFAYLHAGKPEKAEAEFALELNLDYKSESALLGLAETQIVRGQAGAALDAVQKAWDISPEYLALQRGFPEFSPSTAKAVLANLPAAPEGAARDFLLAALNAAAGDTGQADDRWKAFQGEFRAWQNAGHSAAGGQADRDPCSAHRYAECARGLESRPNTSRAEQLLLGKTLFTLQQYDRAADTLASLLQNDKGNVEASYWLARAYQALGGDCYDRLEEDFPQSWRAHQLRAEGYAAREAYNDAIQEYQAALRLKPDEAELHEALGEQFLTKKSYDEARAELETSLKLDSSRARTLCLLGRLYVGTHETEKAVPYLQRALRYQPDMAEASDLLGTAFVRLGQDAQAISELEKAAPYDFYGDVHYQLYVAYRRLGKPELAGKALARSQELRRTSAARHQAMVSGVVEVE